MQDAALIREYLRQVPDDVAGPLREALDDPSASVDQRSLRFTAQKDRLPLSPHLDQNQALLQLITGPSPDMIYRHLILGRADRKALLFFTDNLVGKPHIMHLIEILAVRLRGDEFPPEPKALADFLRQRAAIATEIHTVKSIGDVTTAVLSGDTILMVEGLTVGVRLSTRGWEHRAPEEPQTEPVIRGPKEGFTETLAVNLALVRRRIQSEELRVETFVLGARTRTTVAALYMTGITLPALVDEVRQRLQRIKIDGVIESGTIEELIQDNPYTPFPLVRPTERPDVIESGLLQGKVAIFIDGTPHVLVVPATFTGEMQAAEDYYQHWTAGSFIRALRYLFLVIALLGPSVYVAVTTFHQEMLPTQLLLSLVAAREGLPFPAVIEALLMEVSLEALREAGVRLPKPVGQSISIVGGLIIGESAVRAGIVSPVMVIVVSITAISSFIVPSFGTALAIRMLRFAVMMLAATLGFYGIILGLIAISIHLASLRSFGIPYMSPVMPPTASDADDLFIRAPWWFMRKRPRFMPAQDRVRAAKGSRPGPPR